MRIRLINKMITTYLIGIIISFGIISTLCSKFNYRSELSSQADYMYKAAMSIASEYGNAYSGGDVENAPSLPFLKAVSRYTGCNIILLATDGTILMDTSASGIDTIKGFDPAKYKKSNYIVNDFFGIYDSNYLTVYYPITYLYNTRGYVILSKSVKDVRSDADNSFNFNYITLVICFITSGLIFVLFYKYITRPLNKITKIVSKYAKGDFSEKINIKHNDEIGRLSDSLDYMAAEINSLNEYQKKFIANISHDFRSPLTSIKGYLEAMLDGTIPPEMQEKYLGIVISETERLTKLTNNLLTINNVTDEGMILDISDFDIIATIKKTIETFQGTCEKKKIKFKLIFPDKELMVSADMSKIQQVLYNLIDNAIKFSNSDSSIIISVTEKGDKALISVKDFGIGIPRESISKIWERFYKTDVSRGKDKTGTGLGLSIVKEIITSHNEYIDVVSTEGVGTEFTFALPKAKGHAPSVWG